MTAGNRPLPLPYLHAYPVYARLSIVIYFDYWCALWFFLELGGRLRGASEYFFPSFMASFLMSSVYFFCSSPVTELCHDLEAAAPPKLLSLKTFTACFEILLCSTLIFCSLSLSFSHNFTLGKTNSSRSEFRWDYECLMA